MTIECLADLSDGSGGPCPECDEGALALIIYNNDMEGIKPSAVDPKDKLTTTWASIKAY